MDYSVLPPSVGDVIIPEYKDEDILAEDDEVEDEPEANEVDEHDNDNDNDNSSESDNDEVNDEHVEQVIVKRPRKEFIAEPLPQPQYHQHKHKHIHAHKRRQWVKSTVFIIVVTIIVVICLFGMIKLFNKLLAKYNDPVRTAMMVSQAELQAKYDEELRSRQQSQAKAEQLFTTSGGYRIRDSHGRFVKSKH